MKKDIAAAIVALAIIGPACADFSPYKYIQTYTMIEPAPSADKSYDDGKIAIRFHIAEKRIFFHLTNKTQEPVALNWSEAAFVQLDGSRLPVAGTDAIFTHRRSKPVPTETAPGKEETDFAAPVKNVERLEDWSWYLTPLFNLTDEKAVENRGKIFGLDMPIRVEGEWKVYQFRFKILNVVPTNQRV